MSTKITLETLHCIVSLSQRSPPDATRIDSAMFSVCGKIKDTIRSSGASEQFEISRSNHNIKYLHLHPSLTQCVEIEFLEF